MKVKLLLFAVLQDIVGAPEINLELASGTSAEQVWQSLRDRHSELFPYVTPPLTAINQNYAPADAELHDGDELAFIPPVSGG